MKYFTFATLEFVVVLTTLAQEVSIVLKTLTHDQTKTLAYLKADIDTKVVALDRAEEAYKAAQEQIKKAQGATADQSDRCQQIVTGSGGYLHVPCWTWRFSSDFKYLIRQ